MSCGRTSGVLEAYKSCISRIQLFGPTNFSPTINHVSNIARNFIDGSHYFILLIITDGIISDMEETKEAIVAAAEYPMSIIIVGVGDANFDAMEELDGDDIRLTTRTRQVASRDIVQFVALRNFYNASRNANQNYVSSIMAKSKLAKEVLAEIPDQLVSYMSSKQIIPRNMHASSSNSNGNQWEIAKEYTSNAKKINTYSSDDE